MFRKNDINSAFFRRLDYMTLVTPLGVIVFTHHGVTEKSPLEER